MSRPWRDAWSSGKGKKTKKKKLDKKGRLRYRLEAWDTRIEGQVVVDGN